MEIRTQPHSSPHSSLEPPALHTGGSRARSIEIAPRDRLRFAAVLCLAVGAYGIIARDVVVGSGLSQPIPTSTNIFFRLYGLHEAPFLWLLVLTGMLVWLGSRQSGDRTTPVWLRRVSSVASRKPAWVAALAVLSVTLVGGATVMHGVGLSMDEFAASFQARIFASGRLQAQVPVEWRGLAPWMTPVFINYKPEPGLWVSSYLPVYAGVRALFSLLSAEWLVNPLLAAATVILLAAVTRRLWTGEQQQRAGGLALLFLVTSAQFLVTSMSGYSMAAHLCLNLAWLWLYLRNDRYSLAALPWVGILAVGLHNPVPHALFAWPFLVRLLRERRFARAGYCAAVYVAGCVGWYAWLGFVHHGIHGSTGAATSPGVVSGFLTNFSLPGAFSWFVQGMSLALFFAWQTPALAIFLPVGLMAWRRLGGTERDLALGLIGAWAFYALVDANQGHGWGYRYLYPVLGNAFLLAGRGADELWRFGRPTLVNRLVVASAAITLLFQLPMRLVQTQRFVRPYAAALEYVSTRRAAVVAIDPAIAWYGRDLVRNDPLFEHGPQVVGLGLIRGQRPSAKNLPPSAQGKVHMLTVEELERLGLPVFQQTRR